MKTRMFLRIACTGAVLVLLLIPAASAQGGQGPRGRDPLTAMDANKDGKVTLEEAQAADPNMTAEAFKQRDTNGDGVWSKDDRPPMMEPSSEALDPDKDGQVTQAEYDTAWTAFLYERFGQLDTDKDGALSKEELAKQMARPMGGPGGPGGPGGGTPPPEAGAQQSGVKNGPPQGGGPGGGPMAPSEEALDPNQDGSVTQAEYTAAWKTVQSARFDRLDTDKNGVLSQEELAKQRGPGGRGRGMRGGEGGMEPPQR